MENSNKNEKGSDSRALIEHDQTTVRAAYEYSISSLHRIQTRFAAIDTKASHTMGIIAVVVAILALSFPSPGEASKEVNGLLYAAITLFIGSVLCCLLCIQVRSLLEGPTIGTIIDWLKDKHKLKGDKELLTVLTVDLANAETSHYMVYEKKTKYLFIAQVLEVAGIVLLIISIGLSRLGF